MKKQILISVITLIAAVSIKAQTCDKIILKKGNEITLNNQVFQRDYAALKVYMKLSKDEQKTADDNFAKDVADGKIVLPKNKIIVTVDDIISDDGVTKYSLSNLIKGVIYKTRVFCSNGVLILAPYKDESIIKIRSTEGDSITSTTINGYNKIPLNLKVGDTLPSYQDVTFTSPFHYEFKGISKHTTTDIYGDTWEISQLVNHTIDITTSTITKYVNREVLATEDVVVNSITYKALKIYTEIWTKSTQKTKSSSLGVTIAAPIIQKLIDKKTHKATGANKEGYLVSSLTSWFVPELGVGVKTEIYDFKGNLFSVMTLESIKQ
ncbi:MAG: hypothetical protein ABI388_06255 [Bacteroidia bacterium]